MSAGCTWSLPPSYLGVLTSLLSGDRHWGQSLKTPERKTVVAEWKRALEFSQCLWSSNILFSLLQHWSPQTSTQGQHHSGDCPLQEWPKADPSKSEEQQV